MGKLKKKKLIGDLHQWQKAVKKAGTYAVFEHKGTEVLIPKLFVDSWTKKVKKHGILSVDIHDDIRNYVENFTEIEDKLSIKGFSEFVYALDAFIAEKAGIKVNPKSPVTYRSALKFKKDSIIFFSEKYGSQEVSPDLYYKWLYSLLSNGKMTAKTFSEMHKYAKTGSPKEPAIASFETGKRFVLSIMSDIEKEKPEYPEYFADKMDGLLRKEVEKLAKLNIKPPKKEVGSIAQISKERISIKLKDQELSIPLDPKIYHLIYSATVKNKGKVPNWARQKLYSYLMDVYSEQYAPELKDFDEYYANKALDQTASLVPFFEYKVANDAQEAKKIMEKQKKLKGIPKK